MTWRLFLEPLDVVLFRDGRPFSAGEDHRARSLFPPTPYTIQGALRWLYLALSGVDPVAYARGATEAQGLIARIGAPRRGYGRLRLRGPFVARCPSEDGEPEPLFATPADLVRMGKGENAPMALLHPLEGTPFTVDLLPGTGLRPLWAEGPAPPGPIGGWLTPEGLRAVLEGGTPPPGTLVREAELLEREPRLGIRLEPERRRPGEGLLYQVEFLRLKPGVGFLVEVDGVEPPDPPQGTVRLGGEGRPASYRVLEGGLSLPAVGGVEKRFRVVLLTPALFEEGWRPAHGGWPALFGGAPGRLAGVALGRPQALGGAYLDARTAQDFQRPAHRFVPAGSVYFFEAERPVALTQAFTRPTPGEAFPGQIGFGVAVVGRW